ncbi:Mitochondrial import inner membrane translocase subunit tim22 [Friedmanniomyces endolithicus]|nr:Mitochondrial import inner membrane translocase subunit tim22 [Friedmanniomyces endolithicus]KAK0799691.1 Mitochondrial import inner membrane translocase subunit tim22 [Friedmanniomyces endolithicus]KAK0805357.1 Mitochondrial import inner membrane translocase subunit tim22 [Friedmanniomyces endolithicus]KAK0820545.1 Mitochondrial import inner membrane translocase subunit tim22 [Friedmanniomyces endolithicus]KAK0848233.1 Mitochondrial import inner membrane translocase subunit tim22 [Friedmann
MALPGMGGMGLGGRQSAGMDPQQAQEQQMIKYMQAAMEACPTKTVIAGTMGFGLGGIFGVFMSSMRYDTPMSSGMPGGVGTISDLPMREQLKSGFKDMGRSAYSSAKNFGYIGAVFSGTECCIEGLRAKNDLYNGVAAGCLTGGWLAKGGGPQAVAVGCAGFAAFSAAIDAYMRMPQDDKASDPII